MDTIISLPSSVISIHAPREGSDGGGVAITQGHCISIHAPREGSDCAGNPRSKTPRNFNPRSPGGERRFFLIGIAFAMQFQSTLPGRGATALTDALDIIYPISIHAPREGSDRGSCRAGRGTSISIHAPREGSDGPQIPSTLRPLEFQSTLPGRGATKLSPAEAPDSVFQSTLPGRGATGPQKTPISVI